MVTKLNKEILFAIFELYGLQIGSSNWEIDQTGNYI